MAAARSETHALMLQMKAGTPLNVAVRLLGVLEAKRGEGSLTGRQAALHLLPSLLKIVVRARQLLLPVLGGLHLVDARAVVGGVPPEGDVQIFEEEVHA